MVGVTITVVTIVVDTITTVDTDIDLVTTITMDTDIITDVDIEQLQVNMGITETKVSITDIENRRVVETDIIKIPDITKITIDQTIKEILTTGLITTGLQETEQTTADLITTGHQELVLLEEDDKIHLCILLFEENC